jgi:hypothetical protein
MSADPTHPTPTPREYPAWTDEFDRAVLDQVRALPPILPLVELPADQAQALGRALELAGGFRERIETDHSPQELRYAQAWQLLGRELRDRAHAAERAAIAATRERDNAYIQHAYTQRAERERRQHARGRAQAAQQPGRGEADRAR